MKYVVFESGSRAGFSAEMFFRLWQKAHDRKDVKLIMADSDADLLDVPVTFNVTRRRDQPAEAMFSRKKHIRVFPADEMTRQFKRSIQDAIAHDPCAAVEPWYYEKSTVNRVLQNVTNDECFIKIPTTFDLNTVCIKPNTLSAGSRDIKFQGNVCVSQVIEIQKEYVADVIDFPLKEVDGVAIPYVREVKLRNGYDKMIKFLPTSHKVVFAIMQFINKVRDSFDFGLFSNIFHLQIAEDVNGDLWFIEASKRISGTSIVNVFKGFNPFDLLEGTKPVVYDNPFENDRWYRYEDIVLEVAKML